MKFTDRAIKNLKPKAKRYEVSEPGGLIMRISPSGNKTWIYFYRFEGRTRRMTLGTYPAMSVAQAHKAHAEARELKARGLDPGIKQQEHKKGERDANTVAELVHEYIERHAKKKKRSWQEDKRLLTKDVLPIWGRRKARDIGRRDIIALLDTIVDRGAPIMANRTFEVVRRMFNFAIERGMLEASPCAMVRAPAKKRQRDRVLTEDEIRLFWTNLDKTAMSISLRLALKLQLVTAQRRGEIVAAEWSEFDLTGGWWVMPAEKTKNNLSHRIPLSDLAIKLLQGLKPYGDRYLLQSKEGHMLPGAPTKAIRRNCHIFGFGHFTPHDLRRTAASHMTGMGISRLVVSKILNHAESGVTAVYDRHSYDLEKRQALEAWGEKLKAIIEGKESNPVSLTVAR